jgi:hypothetical protein
MQLVLKFCGMLVRSVPVLAYLLVFQAIATTSVARPSSPGISCVLPPGLNEEVAHKNPGAHVVELSDLNEYDRGLFGKDHGDQCPGLVNVDFYGEGKPTWAFILLRRIGTKQKSELFVARQSTGKWEISSLDNTEGPAPVVWSEVAGKYKGLYSVTNIEAQHPVIIFCGYSSWAVLYAWNGKKVVKTQLSD